jgi:hypothetical protein
MTTIYAGTTYFEFYGITRQAFLNFVTNASKEDSTHKHIYNDSHFKNVIDVLLTLFIM